MYIYMYIYIGLRTTPRRKSHQQPRAPQASRQKKGFPSVGWRNPVLCHAHRSVKCHCCDTIPVAESLHRPLGPSEEYPLLWRAKLCLGAE